MKYRYISLGFLAVFSIIFTILVVDSIAYFILDIKVPGHKPERFFQFSPLLGWFHKPNSEGYWYRYGDGTKYRVSINKYGFSDSERNVKKTRPRIALIGDSTTEFWEAEEKDRGQYIIEELLHNNFEVLNFGVRAYGTDQTYIVFTNVGVHFSPDIVIYTFCINDIWDNADVHSKPYFTLAPRKPGGLVLEGYPIQFNSSDRFGGSSSVSTYSFVYRTLARVLSKIEYKKQDSNHGAHPPLESHFMIRPYKRVYNSEDHRRMEITTKIISLLNDYVKENKMKLLVVEGVYTLALDVNEQHQLIQRYGDKFDFEKVSGILEEYTGENEIAFLSLPALIKDQNINVKELMHRTENTHLNREGILFYSRAVVDKLRSLHWVGGN